MASLPRLRAFLVNTSLVLVVVVALYAALEWGFLRGFPQVFPVSMVQKLDEPDGVWPVLQNSKRGFLPRDYIALAGDSYAMGMGDGMLDSAGERSPRFHSAHAIQDLTGRDVIAFGLPGSGSIRGAISNPVAGLAYLRRAVDKDFPDPDWMVLYFYEGNDLTENWMYYEKTFLPDHSAFSYDNPEVFDQYLRDVALGRQHLYLAAQYVEPKHRFFLARFSYRLFAEKLLGKKFFRKKYPGEFGMIYVPENRWTPRKEGETTNRAMVAGKEAALPDNLQGPALDLTQEQREQAIGTFGKALAWSRAHFPHTQFAVVYIPSVLSTYQLAGSAVEAQNFLSDTGAQFPVAEVERLHIWMRDAVATICRGQGVLFADATGDLRQASARQLLHGPLDWNHLNRDGYKVLGESVVRQLPVRSP